jgi:hypothetical protein
MNKHNAQESQALLQVRQWKEEVYQETNTLTHQEYLERLQRVADKLLTKYQLTLPILDLPSAQHRS